MKVLGYIFVKEKEYNHLKDKIIELQNQRFEKFEEFNKSKNQCLDNEISKIKELMSVYDFFFDSPYKLSLADTYGNYVSLRADSKGYLITDKYIPSFSDLISSTILEMKLEDKINFYKEITPIFVKYVKDDIKLRQFSLCLSEEKRLYGRLKKKRIE